jgi:hypothetical protein
VEAEKKKSHGKTLPVMTMTTLIYTDSSKSQKQKAKSQ